MKKQWRSTPQILSSAAGPYSTPCKARIGCGFIMYAKTPLSGLKDSAAFGSVRFCPKEGRSLGFQDWGVGLGFRDSLGFQD